MAAYFQVNSASKQALAGIESKATRAMLRFNQARTAVFRFRKMKPDETVEFLRGRVKTREEDIALSRNANDTERFRHDLAQCASEAARILRYKRDELLQGAKNFEGNKKEGLESKEKEELESKARNCTAEEWKLLTQAEQQWKILGSTIMQTVCSEDAARAYEAAGMMGHASGEKQISFEPLAGAPIAVIRKMRADAQPAKV